MSHGPGGRPAGGPTRSPNGRASGPGGPKRPLGTTSAATIAATAVVGLAVGGVIPPLYDRGGRVPPSVPLTAPLLLAVFAGAVLLLAWSTWQALHKKRQRMNARRAINLLSLAKSSTLAGAAVAGGYVGFALHFLGALDIDLPRERVIHSALAVAAASALVAGGLLLERACRIPKDDDDDSGPAAA